MKRLQEYEWEANCYGLEIFRMLGYSRLKKWLEYKFVIDMLYLTHFYKTGEKIRKITAYTLKHAFKKPLQSKAIPNFKPIEQIISRNGRVIDFSR